MFLLMFEEYKKIILKKTNNYRTFYSLFDKRLQRCSLRISSPKQKKNIQKYIFYCLTLVCFKLNNFGNI